MIDQHKHYLNGHLAEALIYQAIGRAITEWPWVETSLFALAHCLMSTSYETSSTVFFHLKSAENKTALVDKLCRLHLPQQIYQSSWMAVRKNLSLPIENRNALAHSSLAWTDSDDARSGKVFPLHITSNFVDFSSSKKGGLDLADIHGMAEDFVALSNLIMSFVFMHFPDYRERLAVLPANLLQDLETIHSMATAKAPVERDPSEKQP